MNNSWRRNLSTSRLQHSEWNQDWNERSIISTYWPSLLGLYGESIILGLDGTDLDEAAQLSVLSKPWAIFSWEISFHFWNYIWYRTNTTTTNTTLLQLQYYSITDYYYMYYYCCCYCCCYYYYSTTTTTTTTATTIGTVWAVMRAINVRLG